MPSGVGRICPNRLTETSRAADFDQGPCPQCSRGERSALALSLAASACYAGAQPLGLANATETALGECGLSYAASGGRLLPQEVVERQVDDILQP